MAFRWQDTYWSHTRETGQSCFTRLSKKKKIPVFRVTQHCLNLLVKSRFIFMVSGKNVMLCILKGEMPFKMYKIIFFPEKII